MSQSNISRTPLLLITSCQQTADTLATFLNDSDFLVKTVAAEDIIYALNCNFHIALLDTENCKDNTNRLIHTISEKMPVIILSDKNDEHSISAAFYSGASDYMVKPVRNMELLARIKNVLRYNEKPSTLLHHGTIKVDTVKGVVYRNNREIYLSALEYRILLIFLANKDRILSRRQLLDEIWNIGGDYVSDNTLTVYIKRIREKIEENPADPQLIKTVRGKGYKAGQ